MNFASAALVKDSTCSWSTPRPDISPPPASSFQQCQQEMLGTDVVVPQPKRLPKGELQRLFRRLVERNQLADPVDRS